MTAATALSQSPHAGWSPRTGTGLRAGAQHETPGAAGKAAHASATTDTRLRATLLLRAAERKGTAATITLLGMALAAYGNWNGPERVLLSFFAAAQLSALVWAHLVSGHIVRLHARGMPYLHLEQHFVTSTAAGGAAWGVICWMLPDMQLAGWLVRDLLSAMILVLVSFAALVTLLHHPRALAAHVCAQWAVAGLHLILAPGPLGGGLLIVSILVPVTVLLYARLLQPQTRRGVLAEVRNADLTENLHNTNLQLEQALERAVRTASHDAFTGMLKRHALPARADELAAMRRHQNWPGSVMLLHVDPPADADPRQRKVASDAVARLAGSLRGALRDIDVVACWGEHDFLVLMPDCKVGLALDRAEQVCGRMARFKVPDQPAGHGPSVSIGVADWPLHDELSAVIDRADRALREGRSVGRNRIVLAK